MATHWGESLSDLKEYVISFHKQDNGYKNSYKTLTAKTLLPKLCKITSRNVGAVH